LIVGQLAEIFCGALVVGLVVESAVIGIRRNKAIVVLLCFAIIDRTDWQLPKQVLTVS
jgi:hypothetical protein